MEAAGQLLYNTNISRRREGWAGLGWAGQDAPTVITSTSQTGVETRASNQHSLSKFKVV